MKRPVQCALVLLLVLVLQPLSTRAADVFEMVGVISFDIDGLFSGTRAEALGGADIAGASGPEAQLLNPAPLARGEGIEVAFGQMDWFYGELRNYAIAGEWKRLRWGLVRDELTVDPQPIRTAFDPGGTVETFDAQHRADVLGASWDLSRLLDSNHTLHWSVGAAYRRYSAEVADSSTSANSFDVGSTLGLEMESTESSIALIAVLVAQNVFNQAAEAGGRRASVPRPLRLGVTARASFHPGAAGMEVARVTLAMARTFDLEREHYGHSYFGGEITVFHRLALRAGNPDGSSPARSSWGAGLIVAERWMSPVQVSLDWTRLEIDPQYPEDRLDSFGVSARWEL